jgi:hypothetical protein
VAIVFDHLPHVLDLGGSQAGGDDSRAARLIIEVAPGVRASPTVVARCRETRDSKDGVERQGFLRAADRPKEDPLGFTSWKPLGIELDLRRPKHGDQQSNDLSEQGRTAPEPFDLSRHLRITIGSEIVCNDIGHAAMNPASNR